MSNIFHFFKNEQRKINLILTIFLSIAACSTLIWLLIYFNQSPPATKAGEINIVMICNYDETHHDSWHEFFVNDTLVCVLYRNFEYVVISNGFLIRLCSLDTVYCYSLFIFIYLDDDLSPFGILNISLIDQQRITFKLQTVSF